MSDHVLKSIKLSLEAAMREVNKVPGAGPAMELLSKTMTLVVGQAERGIAGCAIVGKVMLAGEHPGYRQRGVGLHVPGAAAGIDLFFPASEIVVERSKLFVGHDVELEIAVFRPVTSPKVLGEATISIDTGGPGLPATHVETFFRRGQKGAIAPHFEGDQHALVIMLADDTGVALLQTEEQWRGLHRQIGYLLKGKLKLGSPELSS